MSANLETVKAIYAAWERHDYEWVEWAHPDIEFEVADGPSPGRWQGLAGMWQGWREVLGSWQDWRAEELRSRELDGGRVLVLLRFSGRGRASGLDVGRMSGEGANLFCFRGARVSRLVAYWDGHQALAELGLEEDGG